MKPETKTVLIQIGGVLLIALIYGVSVYLSNRRQDQREKLYYERLTKVLFPKPEPEDKLPS